MPKPFHELTADEFIDLLGQFPFERRIESVHMHHTWRPNHADFASRPPIASIQGMFNFHTQVNGWRDIAQHITIDPDGKVWTGRNWNTAPASATGFNGNSAAGPFMFEMIGDFDAGRDPFGGAQKDTAVKVVAALLRRFDLPKEALRFHNQMSTKSCPGSAIVRRTFLDEVEAVLASEPVARAMVAGAEPAAGAAPAFHAFGETAGVVRQRSLTIIANWDAGARALELETLPAGAEPDEDTLNANQVSVITGAESPVLLTNRGLLSGGPDFSADEIQKLRPHVINMRLGLLSDTGKFQTSAPDVKRIFEERLPDELDKQKRLGEPLRLMFFAHGGLVSEEAGIRPCLKRLPFWLNNNIYPIFFCWETGLTETVADLVQSLFKGERGIVSGVTDEVLEAVASLGGREVWGRMKRSAELASMSGGGARMVAELTRELWNEHHAAMEIHAVGHSAGAIFHSFFLPALLEHKPPAGVPPIKVASLHLLAPACTTELFKSRLKDRVGANKQILKHTMYTMNKDLEQHDKAGPYQKSLLYFVSRAFEAVKPTPILGLEESLRDDAALIRFYGLSRTVPGIAQILFSKTPGNAPPDSSTESTKHGDFDDDVKTMNSVGRRILNRSTGTIVGFPERDEDNEVTKAFTLPKALITVDRITSAITREERIPPAQSGGSRRALCIGIDAYPAPNTLAGCVNDAKAWAAALSAAGFQTETLIDGQATRTNILAAMRRLISQSRPGDAVAIQYSGHGTQVQDVDGDETDGLDEALVPVDFGSGVFIIDDDLRGVMEAIPAGVGVTCFMDCCHSGTNTRVFAPTPATDAGGSRPRFMRISAELNRLHVASRQQSREPVAPPRTNANMLEVNFAACRPDQVAFESQGAGDFTRRAIPLLRAGMPGLTNQEFQKRVVDAFGAGARQEPVLDCAAGFGELPLFGAMPAALVATAAAGAGGASADATLVTRLDRIERRLSALER